MKEGLVLLSGGLDSSTLLAKLVHERGPENIGALNIYYGQKNKREMECALWQAEHYGIEYMAIDVSKVLESISNPMLRNTSAEPPAGAYPVGEIPATYVPFRNGLFISIAIMIAYERGYSGVFTAVHQGDADVVYPDCSPHFINHMHHAAMYGTDQRIHVSAPFARLTKTDIVALAMMHKVALDHTWSCYRDGEKPCGECATCIDREKAISTYESRT